MIFAEKKFYEEILVPFGVKFRPVLSLRTGEIMDDVVQLDLPVIDEDMDMTDMKYSDCPKCGRRLYTPTPEDFGRKYKKSDLPHIFEGKELVGNLHAARCKNIIISQQVRQELIKHRQLGQCSCIPLI